MQKKTIDIKLIAPCGMNCALCMAYLREKNHCAGCLNKGVYRAKSITHCIIRKCRKRKDKYCFECKEFPCARLKHLDNRYSTKYEMSMIDNLEFIKKKGIKSFIDKEQKKWIKGNKIYCVHRKKYYKL